MQPEYRTDFIDQSPELKRCAEQDTQRGERQHRCQTARGNRYDFFRSHAAHCEDLPCHVQQKHDRREHETEYTRAADRRCRKLGDQEQEHKPRQIQGEELTAREFFGADEHSDRRRNQRNERNDLQINHAHGITRHDRRAGNRIVCLLHEIFGRFSRFRLTRITEHLFRFQPIQFDQIYVSNRSSSVSDDTLYQIHESFGGAAVARLDLQIKPRYLRFVFFDHLCYTRRHRICNNLLLFRIAAQRNGERAEYVEYILVERHCGHHALQIRRTGRYIEGYFRLHLLHRHKSDIDEETADKYDQTSQQGYAAYNKPLRNGTHFFERGSLFPYRRRTLRLRRRRLLHRRCDRLLRLRGSRLCYRFSALGTEARAFAQFRTAIDTKLFHLSPPSMNLAESVFFTMAAPRGISARATYRRCHILPHKTATTLSVNQL